MAISVKTFKVKAEGGDVIVRLQAFNALPIEGVISNFAREAIPAEPDDEPTQTTFRLPAESRRYVLYGVITPTKRVWGSPKYERTILQDDQPVDGKTKNPARITTRKISAGEYVGPPEVISIETE